MLGPDPQPDPDPEPDPDPVPEPVPVKPILRIQPLGDSITKGSGSSDDNGYRGPLRDMIVSDITDEVDMVGSLAHGTMPDSSHEGHSGHMLASIRDYAESSLGASPNVVLLHAGTNNMDLEVDVEAAPRIIQQIIDKVHDRLPDTVVIVAKIIWANDARMQANTDAYNTKIEALVADNQDVGRPVLLADMSNILTTADLNDKKHPNNSGYRKMAMVWLDAIKDGIERGWITEPKTPTETQGVGLGVGHGSGAVYNCEGGNWEKHERFFDGFQTWEERGEIIPAKLNGHRDKVILADLNGDGRADYVLADNDGSVRAWINNGLGLPFTEYGNINPAWESVTGNMIRMADVDNDGLADLIILYSDGAAKVWKNTDGGRTFQALDAKWATGLESREKVHFQDVDGDGYADYVIVYSGGAVKWARNNHNNGQDSSRGNWEAAVTIAPGPQGVPQDRTRLYDLDGDGKTGMLPLSPVIPRLIRNGPILAPIC
jgi:lysophospholipase L1-like esterase